MQTLLEMLADIQDSAVDTSRCDMATLMLKAYRVAVELDNQPLQKWIRLETDGYPDEAQVPGYRLATIRAKVYIPRMGERALVEQRLLRQGVSFFEEVAKAPGGVFNLDMNTEFSAMIGGVPGAQAWTEVSATAGASILNAIRFRLVDFAVKMHKEVSSPEKTGKTDLPTTEQVTQIFYTTIHNNSGPVAITGSARDSVIAPKAAARDYNEMEGVLIQNGLPEDAVANLCKILNEERNPVNGQFGPKLQAWVDEIKRKVQEGTLTIATDFVIETIRKTIGL